jgi:hypothetical protein
MTITIDPRIAASLLHLARSAAANAAAAIRFYTVEGDMESAERWRRKEAAWLQLIADVEVELNVSTEQRELHSLDDIQL